MFNKIDQSRPLTNNGYTLGSGPYLTASGFRKDSLAGNTSVDNLLPTKEFYRGSFNLGSGVIIDSNGTVVYDAVRDGKGLIYDLLLVNRGNNTLFFAINSTGIASIGESTPLGSGESYALDTSSIRSLSCKTNSGTALLQANGVYGFQRNAV